MLEIPESKTLGEQADNELAGKRISKVVGATSPHSFTWYNGTPEDYAALLVGRRVESAAGHGAFVDINFEDDVHLTVGDGTNMTYYNAGEAHPKKHQLLIEFDDGTFIAFTVSMYGSIMAYRGELDNPYHKGALGKVSPLEDAFDRAYFDSIVNNAKANLSVKALLATEQRIPGLGNGVLQDIIFSAGIHPKRKMSTLSEMERGDLFLSLKGTLRDMADKGGRDTEKDLFGEKGGYKTILSKNTYKEPCPNCGGDIVKEAYLGGTIYYCPVCQKM